MPLIIRGEKISSKPNIDSFVEKFSHFKENSKSLHSQEPREVGAKGLLYICQREVAGTSPTDDAISILGSQDATTCHIAVLRHTGSGATSLCHFDGSSVAIGLETMVSIVKENTSDFESGRLEIHLIGGFLDNRFNSHDVSNDVLGAIFNSKEDLHLETACITHFNTIYKENGVSFPIIYGIACNVRTGEIFPARFPDKGPDIPLRSARHLTGSSENIIIYNNKTHCLTIGPFTYTNNIDYETYLGFPDKFLRQYLSTSPEQEPESFENDIRQALLQIKNFPYPMKSVFKNGKARTYLKDAESGLWNLQE